MANGFEKLLKNIKRMSPLLVFACFFFFFLLSPIGGFVWWVQPEWKEYAWKTRKKQREKGNSREKETEFVLFLFSSWLLFWNIYHSVGRILIFHIMFGVQLFICLPHSPFLSLSPLSIYQFLSLNIATFVFSPLLHSSHGISKWATKLQIRDAEMAKWFYDICYYSNMLYIGNFAFFRPFKRKYDKAFTNSQNVNPIS